MPDKINALAANLARDHERFGLEQVKSLIHAAQDGPGITGAEEAALEGVLERYADRLDPTAARAFRSFLDTGIEAYRWQRGQPRVSRGPWEPGLRGVNLDPTGATGPVFLSATGAIVTSSDSQANPTIADRADGLYRLARLVDDIPGNIFAPTRNEQERRLYGNLFGEAKVDLELKGNVLDQLLKSLEMVRVGQEPPAGLDAGAALQMRSSSATVLLHLMESLPNSGEALALKTRAFAAYKEAVLGEEHPVLRDSMIFNLYHVRDSFAADLRASIDELYPKIAPTTPPYDDWFKDGNDTLKISWRSGIGDNNVDDFLKLDTDAMESLGDFTIVTDEPNHRVLEKEYTVNGKTTKIILDFQINRNSMFENMDDPDTDIVVYHGHSDLGRNIRHALDNAEDMQGAKLLFVTLCSGKDGLFRMRERYPDAQIITTYDSGYFGWGWSEGSGGIMATLDGIAAREDWSQIDQRLRRSLHGRHALDLNFLVPTHTLLRRRVLDQDHDGQADILDRLVDFNLVQVEQSTRREFQAVRPNHPVEKLDGTNVHIAAMSINTMVLYNDVISSMANVGRVAGDGYFVPREGEENQIVRFIEDEDPRHDIDGTRGTFSTIRMQVNANYAHMSEEALRAVACYELNNYLAKTDPDKYFRGFPSEWRNEAGVKLVGLIFAAANLSFDMSTSYFGIARRDRQVWKGLLQHSGLPEIEYDQLARFINGIGMGADQHHDYTGSVRVLKAFIDMLTPEQIAAIRGEN